MEKTNTSLAGRRMVAFYIDHVAVIICLTILGIIEHNFDIDDNVIIQCLYLFFVILSLTYYIWKDVLKGKSVGKRIMKIKVVDRNGETPLYFWLIMRNITIFLLPVECFFVLQNKTRLGDRFAETTVVAD